MPTRVQFNRTLKRLVSLLKAKPMTAKAIAEAMECCRPTAYQRLEALRSKGVEVYEVRQVTKGKTGPRSTAYGVSR